MCLKVGHAGARLSTKGAACNVLTGGRMKGILFSVLTTLVLATSFCQAGPPYAIAVRELNLNGNNLFCDSFNSADTNRSTDGRYDPLKAGDLANVASESGILNTIGVGNVEIWGSINTSTQYTLAIGPLSSIGSVAWHQAAQTGIEPGYHFTDFQWIFPDVAPPFGGAVPAPGIVDGVSYTFVLTTGDYRMSSLTMSGNQRMIVLGPARLHVTGTVNLSGNASILIVPEGKLEWYVGGAASIRGDGIINQGTANGFLYLGLAGSATLNLRTVTPLLGSIYAPSVACTITAGGSAEAEIHGIIICRTLALGNSLQLHYDEALNQ
jgi:hypothetical protein